MICCVFIRHVFLPIIFRLWRKLLNRQGATGGADLQIAKVIMHMIDAFAKQELDIRTNFVHRYESQYCWIKTNYHVFITLIFLLLQT